MRKIIESVKRILSKEIGKQMKITIYDTKIKRRNNRRKPRDN